MIEYICKTIAILGICCMCSFVSTVNIVLGAIGLVFGTIIIGIIWES